MRPLELELTSFRSYDRATVDLRPHDLVVITGDTGAGKTSLLDAICFALFGRTPEQRRTSELLTLGHRHGEVRLAFTTRGDVWRVTRRYGPDAPDPALLLERLDGDGGASVETLAGEAAAGSRLASVVGMSFAAFTSAVLLAQGRFAEFLAAAPRDRDAILRELFGVASLEGARQAALRHEEAAAREAEIRTADALALPAHGAAARGGAARAARAAAAARAQVRGLRPTVARLARHRAEEAAARAGEAAAGAAAGGLPARDEAAHLAERLATARRAAGTAEARRSAAAALASERATAREQVRARQGGGAAELAALRERAQRGARLDAELPAREEALAMRERALAGRRASLAALEAQMEEHAAENARLDARDTALERWHEASSAAESAAAELPRAEEAMATAGTDRTAAETRLRQAEEAREQARRHDLAAALRSGLAAGDPCPVCGAAVRGHLPADEAHRDGDEALARARAAVTQASQTWAGAEARARAARAAAAACEEARAREERALAAAGIAPGPPGHPGAARARASALAAAQAGLRAEERDLAGEGARCEGERERLERDRAERDADRASLGPWGTAGDPAAALAAAMAEVRGAEEAADAAVTAAAAAADRAVRAGADAAALEAGPIAALRAAAARVAAGHGLEAPDDDVGAEDLIAAVGRLRDAALAAAAAHGARAERAAAAGEEAQRELARAGGPLGVTDAEGLEAALRRAERARESARARLAEIEGAAAAARDLQALSHAARERARVHHQVATDLRANAFPRFLLGRYRERLAVGASARLQELTGGAYRFSGSEPDPMAVVDMRRGERRRPAGTLSGGERFLASLALALGLSDVAAESGGRLDCLFLDEGFSTLDAESLEQALAGVERLAGDGRLVGVITHLPGVADRLGTAIHVRKDPAGASHVVVDTSSHIGASTETGPPVMVAR